VFKGMNKNTDYSYFIQQNSQMISSNSYEGKNCQFTIMCTGNRPSDNNSKIKAFGVYKC
jgi:putative IMPACT (imprinted ancient) family translation regulator